jgi:hypothetical protein
MALRHVWQANAGGCIDVLVQNLEDDHANNQEHEP